MLATYVARLGVTAVQMIRRPKLHPLDEIRLPITIWPQDIDVYGHVNNGRYLTLMDLGRWSYSVRTGTLRTMLDRKWLPLIGAAVIEFRRELKVFQRCELVTRVLGWDAKWVYIEHRLEREGVIHSRALVRAVFKQGRQTISFDELLAAIGLRETSPFTTEELSRQVAEAMVPSTAAPKQASGV